MSNRSIDSKREEFRKYLEKAGVMDTLTRIITMIYENEDKPTDPLQFVRDQILKASPAQIEQQLNQKYLESAKERIAMLEIKNEVLEAENEKLKQDLENYKTSSSLSSTVIPKNEPSS